MKSLHLPLLVTLLIVIVTVSWFLFQRMYVRENSSEELRPTTESVNTNYHVITIKFRENSKVRLRNQVLTSLVNGDLTAIRVLLSDTKIIEIQRLFTRPEDVLDQERQALQATSSAQIADLNSYYLITLKPEISVADAKELIDQLNQQPAVETAYAEPTYHLAGFFQTRNDATMQRTTLGKLRETLLFLVSAAKMRLSGLFANHFT